MKKQLQDKYAEAAATGKKVPLGDIVVCDICDKDYTNSDASGGFIFGSYGYCPSCAEKGLNTIKRYNEEHYIRAFCPMDTSFADFVRKYRGPDAGIHIQQL